MSATSAVYDQDFLEQVLSLLQSPLLLAFFVLKSHSGSMLLRISVPVPVFREDSGIELLYERLHP